MKNTDCGQIYHVLSLVALVLAVCSALNGGQGCSKQPSVQAVGYRSVVKGDVALVLYADIFNDGNFSVHMEVIVKKCCLFLPKEKYCKGMNLIGDHQGDVQPMKSKLFNFVYPTLYPYDREGKCELLVSANTSCDGSYREVIIPFNTRVPRDWWTDWLPHSIQTVLFGVGVRDCGGVDEDRLRSCVPVNCQLKYGGTRNFFNSTERKCMAVPKCGAKLYDPVNNECRASTDHLDKEIYTRVLNKSSLHATVEEGESPNWRTLVGPRLSCGGHGQLSDDHLDCRCDPHWKTDTTKSIGQGEVTMMCNVHQKITRKTKISSILAFVFSVFILLVAVVICLYMRARAIGRRYYQPSTRSYAAETESCFPKLLSNCKPTAGTGEESSHMTGVGQTSPLAADGEDSQDEI
ncbi:uncharacterized protein LOC110448351 [Mizuhopecten yessoensis]|uniref:Uncharacterized protein n=1 Tax=Mizuhopecten yessoensis TaxID=6573 RepID=A0A210QTD2_MIZYE|nr:uncharacterized protein LOC110448351 [Mizuhopecten yessoensis]OWF51998.1 hypothetical protein KP79_PYT06694 [Mizuhopecten yessoensis]